MTVYGQSRLFDCAKILTLRHFSKFLSIKLAEYLSYVGRKSFFLLFLFKSLGYLENKPYICTPSKQTNVKNEIFEPVLSDTLLYLNSFFLLFVQIFQL